MNRQERHMKRPADFARRDADTRVFRGLLIWVAIGVVVVVLVGLIMLLTHSL